MGLKSLIAKTRYSSAKEESAYAFVRGAGYLTIAHFLVGTLQFLAETGLPMLAMIPSEYQTAELGVITGILLALDKYARKKGLYAPPE